MGVRHRGLLFSMDVSSDPAMCRVVRAVVERLAESAGFNADDGRAVTLAVDEALTNIIRHAYGGRNNRTIHIDCSEVTARKNGTPIKGLRFTLIDSGKAMNPGKIPERSLQEVRPGGLGLHFIRECMHAMNYRRSRGKNILQLVRYVSSQDASKTHER